MAQQRWEPADPAVGAGYRRQNKLGVSEDISCARGVCRRVEGRGRRRMPSSAPLPTRAWSQGGPGTLFSQAYADTPCFHLGVGTELDPRVCVACEFKGSLDHKRPQGGQWEGGGREQGSQNLLSLGYCSQALPERGWGPRGPQPGLSSTGFRCLIVGRAGPLLSSSVTTPCSSHRDKEHPDWMSSRTFPSTVQPL